MLGQPTSDSSSGFFGRFHVLAVERRASGEKSRAENFAALDFAPQFQVFRVAQHPPNGRHAVHGKQRKHLFHRLQIVFRWDVGVHFGEAGHEEFARRVYHQRVAAVRD